MASFELASSFISSKTCCIWGFSKPNLSYSLISSITLLMFLILDVFLYSERSKLFDWVKELLSIIWGFLTIGESDLHSMKHFAMGVFLDCSNTFMLSATVILDWSSFIFYSSFIVVSILTDWLFIVTDISSISARSISSYSVSSRSTTSSFSSLFVLLLTLSSWSNVSF